MGLKSVSFGARSLSLILVSSLIPAPAWARADPLDPCAPDAACPNDARRPAPASGLNPLIGVADRHRQRSRGREREGADPAMVTDDRLEAIGGTVLADQLTGNHWVSRRDLDRRGPRFPARQALGRFEVQGYARGGWPLVLDLETQPGATTWLEVHVKGTPCLQAIVRIPPGDGRRVVVVTLPGSDRPNAAPARFKVNSALVAAGRKPAFQPLRVYAIGAGPYAVGSTTLDVTSFAPQRPTSAAQVRYSLLAHRFYLHSVVEVLRLPPPGGKRLARIAGKDFSPLRQGPTGGNWGTLGGPRIVPKGVYHLQARAWRITDNKNDRDWTGAMAANYVFIP